MKVGLLYRRTSTSRQGISLEAQENTAVEYCRVNNIEIYKMFPDEDVTTKIPFERRRGGRDLLTAIERLKVERPMDEIHVVAAKQDRLGRDTIDQVTTIRKFWAGGVMPHLVLETGAFPKTPQNELLLGIKASVNQYERDQIRDRIQIALDHRRSQGFITTKPTWGWDARPTGKLNPANGKEIRERIPNDFEQGWIRQMATWLAAGLSYQKITDEMNARGVPTKHAGKQIIVKKDRRTGVRTYKECSGRWSRAIVRNIMTSLSTVEWLAGEGVAVTWDIPERMRIAYQQVIEAKKRVA